MPAADRRRGAPPADAGAAAAAGSGGTPAETGAGTAAGTGPAAGAGPGAAAGAGAGPAGAGGLLYVVATPIGNLADVTLRALETLRSVPLVAAEDTRVTRRLLARHEIATRMVSYHERNAAARAPELLAHLRSGADLALVTDAGTPLVSDPGAGLVAAWAAEGGRVIPIPGPSAVVAAVSVAGVVGAQWSFEGFLPRAGRERRERLARIAADPRATVVYEAPPRLAATLRDLAAACGEDRPAAVCRELTKIHESIVRGTLRDLRDAVAAGAIPARGEMVVVVGDLPEPRRGRAHDRPVCGSAADGAPAADPAAADAAARLDAARAEVERLAAGGMPRGEAARTVGKRTGIPRRALYGAPGSGEGGSSR